MKLIKNTFSTIKNLFKQLDYMPNEESKSAVSGHDCNNYLKRHEQEIFGDKMEQQKLYEKWVVKKSWQLRNEAMPLLSGFDPESYQSNCTENDLVALGVMWKHARQCVELGLLKVINLENKPDDWQVYPIDAYHWATLSRIQVPEVLSTLMDFILSAVKQPMVAGANGSNSIQSGISNDSILDREANILGMAFAILAARPGACRNESGKIQIEKIIEIIKAKGEFWVDRDKLSMSDNEMFNLLERWLKTLPRNN